MKTYRKVHESKKVANIHIAKIIEKDGVAYLKKNNGNLVVEYNYNQAKPIFKEKPIWANYVAQHPNGEWWYYQQAPTIVNKYGWKNDENQFGSDVFSNPNKWDKTYYKIDKDGSIR